jgi:hypothetical protein
VNSALWTAWWSLPGPATYLDEVLDVLRQGRSVVLALPRHAPPGLEEAFAAAVSRDRVWRWTAVEPIEGESPLHSAVRACWAGGEGPVGVSSLVQDPRMRNRVLWLDTFSDDRWACWQRWLGEFAHASQHQRPRERAVCACITVGIPPAASARSLPALGVVQWRGRLDGIDLRVWAAMLARGTERARFEHELRRELIAEISAGDPALALSLVELQMSQLLDVDPVIDAYANERGWAPDGPAMTWETGAIDLVGGEEAIHPAALLAGPQSSRLLTERVWRAQVRVIFPFIEGERRRLIQEFREHLSVPFYVDSRREPIVHVEDLEIGHLHQQLRGRVGARREALLKALYRARNALAHLELLDAADVEAILRVIRT